MIVKDYLVAKGHKGKENAVKQKEITAQIGMEAREIRRQIAENNADIRNNHLISFCNKGIYLVTDPEEIRQFRNRAIRAIKRQVKRVRKADYLLNETTQLAFDFDIEWDNDTITSI